jgi:hypothetical protein
MDIRSAQPKLRPITAASAVLLGLAIGPPPRSNGPRSNARPVNRTRCGSASSTSLTLAVSGRACRVTVATSVPPAVPCSRAVRRRMQDALGERLIRSMHTKEGVETLLRLGEQVGAAAVARG